MEASIIYALITVLIVGALLLVAVQVRQLRYIKQQQLDELQQPYRCMKCGTEEAGAAIRRSAIVKRQKREARQRKAGSR